MKSEEISRDARIVNWIWSLVLAWGWAKVLCFSPAPKSFVCERKKIWFAVQKVGELSRLPRKKKRAKAELPRNVKSMMKAMKPSCLLPRGFETKKLAARNFANFSLVYGYSLAHLSSSSHPICRRIRFYFSVLLVSCDCSLFAHLPASSEKSLDKWRMKNFSLLLLPAVCHAEAVDVNE